MPMYNLIEYSDNYSKTSGSLWQYCTPIMLCLSSGNIYLSLGNYLSCLFVTVFELFCC